MVRFSAVRDQAFWRRILAAGALLTLSLLAATLLATTAGVFWLGDLAVHFPVQYAGLALLVFRLFLDRPAPRLGGARARVSRPSIS